MDKSIFFISGRLTKPHAEYADMLRLKGAKDVKNRLTKSVTHILVEDVDNLSSKINALKDEKTIVDEAWVESLPFISELKPSLTFRVTLAKKFKDQNVDGWLCSEKLDGIRAVWDGYQFWSRSGNPINVPPEFTRAFPQVIMDGEIFGGRGQFDSTSGIVRKKVPDYSEWCHLNYCVFDCPHVAELPFVERYGYLQKLISGQVHLKLCEHVVIQKENIPAKLSDIVDKGGEGLMLRNPQSLYEYKRTSSLLKVKVMHDAEAVVIGYESGTGKYRGLTGSLMCEYRGRMFKCGSGLTDEQRANPPRIGTEITFGYFEIGPSGVPRFPTFKRVFSGRV